jgi:NADH dehydrogenase
MSRKHRVVVVGAGFGGLRVARGLENDDDVHVTIVDANNFHTFQPLLYQVATAGLDIDDIAYPVRGVFRRRRRIEVRVATVIDVDLDGRTIVTDRGEPLPYDTLVIAAGSVSHDFGIPGVEEHAIGLKTAGDALSIRNRILSQFERADLDGVDDHALDVIVCGGGPTGVELAGGLVELYARVLSKDFPHLPVASARITLIEAEPRLLGAFDPKLGERAARTLGGRGVDVSTGVAVERIDAGVVTLTDGHQVRAGTIVWAAGVRAAPLAELLGTEIGRGGRIVVGPDLAIPDHPEVFAIGDIAVDPDHPLPQVAQPAIQGGKHVAAQVRRRIDGRPTEPFHYLDKGSMATIGRHDAIAEFPNGWTLTGPIGWLAWLGLHLLYLVGFRNRLNVFVNWAWNYLTYDRASRLLTPTGD